MYAVVTTGGKQYRVEAGSELIVERLAEEPGASITFDRVLLLGDGEAVTVGTPTVDGASVSGTVIGEARGPKLIVFKFKQKVKYRRTTGHRQHLTRVRIDEISDGRSKSKKTGEAAPEASTTTEAPAKPARAPRARKAAAKAEPEAEGETTAAESEAEAEVEKPKPAPRRRSTAKKAESEE